MNRLIIIPINKAKQVNEELIEEFGHYAENTFSVNNTIIKNKQEFCVACWNMDSYNFDKLTKRFNKMKNTNAVIERKGSVKKLKELKYEKKKPNKDVEGDIDNERRNQQANQLKTN